MCAAAPCSARSSLVRPRIARDRSGGAAVKSRSSTSVVVVGGGQAGLSTSYYLGLQSVAHVVLEQDTTFSSWRNRWDGFRANTPNWMNTLPMLEPTRFPTGHRKGFATKEQLLEYFDECLRSFEPPVRTGVCVTSVRQRADLVWEVESDDEIIEAAAVVICVGAMSSARLPATAASVPPSVPQLHSSLYRNPDQVETRSVLVVGSGSSGVQISRLLGESGRFDQVHLSVSKVLVLPRSVMGIQIHRFIHFFRLFDVRTTSPLGKLMYSGLETRGDPIMPPDPRDLARTLGLTLHGRLTAADHSGIQFSDGERLSPDDLTIIWCTGFRSEFSFIYPVDRSAAFDRAGRPIHRRGVVDGAPGLYFVGLRYQHTVASHDIYGVGADARYIADTIRARSVAPTSV